MVWKTETNKRSESPVGCWKANTFKKKNKMKKKLLLLLVIIAGIILTACNLQYVQDEQKSENEKSMFVVVERTMTWIVVYHKTTKVMYAVSSGSYNGGTFTMLCDKDGKPQLWEESVNE